MGRKAKNIGRYYFSPKDYVDCASLPNGFFYKNKFYTEAGCVKELIKDGEVSKHDFFTNGVWQFNGICYKTLEELLANEDTINAPFGFVRKNWREFGIKHDNLGKIMYSFDKDDDNRLFASKAELLYEMRNELNDFIEDQDDREERYLDRLTKNDCLAYFKKTIKERIKILEELL